MYQDRKQWARLAYSILMLVIVWGAIQPDMMSEWDKWGRGAGILQLTLFTISAGLLLPKAKQLSYDLTSDTKQFIAGTGVNLLGWLMIFM